MGERSSDLPPAGAATRATSRDEGRGARAPEAPLPADARPDDALAREAVLRRRIRAPIGRVWENVLDWEHLPGLHRGSFDTIECQSAGPWGWAAWVGARGARSLVSLRIDRAGSRYLARTLAGPGAGSEIWTALAADGDVTNVHVEFWVPPGADAGRRARSLAAQYERLWSEDEEMMMRREALLAALRESARHRVEIELGPLDALRASLPRRIELRRVPYQIVELAGRLVAHAAFCPHMLGPLEGEPDAAGALVCPWHRYRFDLSTGRCTHGGPYRLAAAPSVDVSDPTNVRLTLT